MDLRSWRPFDGKFRNKIAFASMTNNVDLDSYELKLGDEKKFHQFLLLNNRVLQYAYNRGSLLFQSIFVYLS